MSQPPYDPPSPVWRAGFPTQPQYPAPYVPQPAQPLPYQRTAGTPQSLPPTPPPRRPEFPAGEDAKAALAAYAELGPEYSAEVVDSFLAQMDSRMANRQMELFRQNSSSQVEYNRERAERRWRTTWLVICLTMAIPLTAIALSAAGFFGLVVSWIGVIAVAAFSTGFGRGFSNGRRPPELER